MENSTINIGAVLKAQREKLGYSLDEASQHTCIRKTFLESIEDNQFSGLPGQVYVVGFIKSYALYLGLDSNFLLSELEEPEMSDSPPAFETIPILKSQPVHFGRHAKGGWRTFMLALLVVLILGGATYLLLPLFQTGDHTQVTSSQTLAEPVATEPAATEPKPVPIKIEAAEEVTKIEPVVVVPEEKNEPISVADVTKTPENKPLPLIPPQGSSLRMLAQAESSLIIYVDDRKPEQFILYNGLDLTWKIKAKVKVELAGSGVARFWLRDRELDLDELKSFQLEPASPL